MTEPTPAPTSGSAQTAGPAPPATESGASPPQVPAAPQPPLDPAFVPNPTIEAGAVSVWFGQKVAVSELSCSFGPGVTGLLGPNGAGKTTFMRVLCGLLPPNEGQVRVLGCDPRRDRSTQRDMTLVPEDDAIPGTLTARQLVRYTAALHSVRDRAAPDQSLATVGLVEVADRKLSSFSKGMRQRAKVAAALVTRPQVLVLDEPLNGADPVQRVALIELFQWLGQQGHTVLVSSHVLHEVERLAGRQIVIVRGRLAAAGDHRSIRDSLADRPRSVQVRTNLPRKLGAELLGVDVVSGITVDGSSLVVATLNAGELAAALPAVARKTGATLREVRPLDDSLEAVFRELTR